MAAQASAQTQADLLADVGGGDDLDTERIFERAEAEYGSAALIYARAKVIAYEQLLAKARIATTYKMGDISENLSDIAKSLEKALAKAEMDLDDLINKSRSRVRIVSVRPKNTRKVDVPHD